MENLIFASIAPEQIQCQGRCIPKAEEKEQIILIENPQKIHDQNDKGTIILIVELGLCGEAPPAYRPYFLIFRYRVAGPMPRIFAISSRDRFSCRYCCTARQMASRSISSRVL